MTTLAEIEKALAAIEPSTRKYDGVNTCVYSDIGWLADMANETEAHFYMNAPEHLRLLLPIAQAAITFTEETRWLTLSSSLGKINQQYEQARDKLAAVIKETGIVD